MSDTTTRSTTGPRRAWQHLVSAAGRPGLLIRLALASVIANVGIVVTGGAVRLTGSGLGCPTWPTCTDASYTPNQAMGIHGAIEFSNRMLTFAVGAIAALALLAAVLQRPRHRCLVTLAALVLAVIPAQAVVGGLTVLTDLNPWLVACHFLVSIAIIAAAYTFWRRSIDASSAASPSAVASPEAVRTAVSSPDAVRAGVPAPLRVLSWLLVAASAVVLAIGTIVTGSGPHAGDLHARRTGLDPRAVSQLHTDAVFLLVGLSVAMWFALRAASAPRPAIRAAAILVAVELGQGVIGFVQYVTHLPELLVGLHMFGACLVWLATLDTLHHTRSAPLSAALTPLARPAQSAPPAPPGPSAQSAQSAQSAPPAPPGPSAPPDEPAAPAQPVPSAQPAESVPASLRT